jgi:hypothetical protein
MMVMKKSVFWDTIHFNRLRRKKNEEEEKKERE